MNRSFEKVTHHLFGNENIDSVSVEQIRQLAEEYPYFSFAQLLLTKKLTAENDPAFLQQVQKSVLYFSNPYWLYFRLNNPENFILESEEKLIPEEIYENEKEHDFSLKAQQVLETNPADSYNKNIENPEPLNQAEEETAVETRDTDEETNRFLSEVDESIEIPERDNIEQVVQEILSPDEQNESTEVLEEMAGVINEPAPATEAFLQEAEAPKKENSKENYPEEPFSNNIPLTEKPSFFVDSKEADTDVPDEHDLMFRNIKAMLDATSEEANADVNDTFVPIDPYYTIDYFASQGIKLRLDPNPKDELGQNLKKFTQWLKHMKKLGPEDAAEVISRNKETDADIQKIADSSNTVREVVTEAMASVLEKQGKKDKAIELYNKLSFLNPDKSIYFANKIKSLKGT